MLPPHPRRSRRSPALRPRSLPLLAAAGPVPTPRRGGDTGAAAAALLCACLSATHRDGWWAREAACYNTAGRPGTCMAHSPAAAAPRRGAGGGGGPAGRGGAARSPPTSPPRRIASARPPRPAAPAAPLSPALPASLRAPKRGRHCPLTRSWSACSQRRWKRQRQNSPSCLTEGP